MDIQIYKYHLIEELTKVQDINILKKLMTFLKSEKNIALQNAIDEALDDLENGKVRAHNEVMSELRNHYKK